MVASAVAGATWRVLESGAIWVGTETWPDADAPGDLLEEDEVHARDTYGVEAPAFLPAVTVSDRRVSRVEHIVEPESVRTVLSYEDTDTPRGPELLRRIARASVGQHVAGPVDYLAVYEGRVVKQSSDGATVDVQLDVLRGQTGDAIASPSTVRIRHGLPGATVKVSDARVLVGWIGGDPNRPYVAQWRDGATVTSILIEALLLTLGGESGAEFVARLNDAISVGTWVHVPAAGAGVTPCSLAYVPPGGISTPIVAPGVAVTGKITGSASRVKAK